jgi:hypothetical protein
MVGRVLLAFLAAVGVSLGVLWMRGGLQVREEAAVPTTDRSQRDAPRQITLAVQGMT